jgi:hypothetical protein
MRAHRTSAWVAIAVALASCTGEPPRMAPEEHEARTTLTGGLTPGTKPVEPSLLIVNRAPPLPPVEKPDYDHRPDDDFVWVPGYWRWDTDVEDFVWVSGGWMRPPRERAWIAPRWVDISDGRYRFLPGYWR